jgi:hypothetical protein
LAAVAAQVLALTSLLASMLISPLSSRATFPPQVRLSSPLLSMLPPMENSLLMLSLACTAT